MSRDQLPDGFNFGATNIAPAITKLRLHDRQHTRSILERKPVVEPFSSPALLFKPPTSAPARPLAATARRRLLLG
jgi:hypothetical protein